MVASKNIRFSKQGFDDCSYPFVKVESKDVYEQYIWLSEKKSLHIKKTIKMVDELNNQELHNAHIN